jgi:anti-anti-sigma factor
MMGGTSRWSGGAARRHGRRGFETASYRRAAGSVMVLVVTGDIDMASSPQLSRRVSSLMDRANFQCLVIDLNRVTFFGAAGVRCLRRGHAAAAAAGAELYIAAADVAPAAHVLDLCDPDLASRRVRSVDVVAMTAGPSPRGFDGR